MNFDAFVNKMRNNKDFYNTEKFILNTIKNEDYPVGHPFSEYPYTASSMFLIQIIILKMFGVEDEVIKDLIKKCKAVEHGKFNYDRYRQNINEVLFLYYVIIGMFTKKQFIPEVLYQSPTLFDNLKIPEYSLLFKYQDIPFSLNIEVKTLSCEAIPKGKINDGDQYILPYYKDENFISDLSKKFPSTTILTDKCCIFQLERNIHKIVKKFDGNNLTRYTFFNIGVIFIDRSSSIEQYHSYFFNNKFGLMNKTFFGNIDALVIMTMDAKVDLKMSNIYNNGYVQTILFKDLPMFVEICKVLRLDNFIMVGNRVREDVINNSKKEYEVLKILKRDGFINFIPYDTTEDKIQEYLDFLKSDIPRNLNYP